MNAPKRSLSQTAAPSLRNEESRWMEGRQRWLRQFDLNRSSDCTASRAWEMLTGAGLESVAHHALYLYAHPPSDRLKEEERKLQQINRKIKALTRASRVEKVKRNAGDPRTGLFSERSLRKENDLWDAEMPFAFDRSTVGDWVTRRLNGGKGICDPPGMRKAFASLGRRCPIQDRKFWLYTLRCHASSAGVNLGAGRLAALAHCADPSTPESHLESRTLARTFKLFSSLVDADRPAIREIPLPLPLVPPQSL